MARRRGEQRPERACGSIEVASLDRILCLAQRGFTARIAWPRSWPGLARQLTSRAGLPVGRACLLSRG
jgi:hypothetical protein